MRSSVVAVYVSVRRQIWSDLKEETESMYSVHTMKETTPLSKTGPFVYDGPFAASNDSAIVDRQAPTDDIATLDVSSPADQYWYTTDDSDLHIFVINDNILSVFYRQILG